MADKILEDQYNIAIDKFHIMHDLESLPESVKANSDLPDQLPATDLNDTSEKYMNYLINVYKQWSVTTVENMSNVMINDAINRQSSQGAFSAYQEDLQQLKSDYSAYKTDSRNSKDVIEYAAHTTLHKVYNYAKSAGFSIPGDYSDYKVQAEDVIGKYFDKLQILENQAKDDDATTNLNKLVKKMCTPPSQAAILKSIFSYLNQQQNALTNAYPLASYDYNQFKDDKETGPNNKSYDYTPLYPDVASKTDSYNLEIGNLKWLGEENALSSLKSQYAKREGANHQYKLPDGTVLYFTDEQWDDNCVGVIKKCMALANAYKRDQNQSILDYKPIWHADYNNFNSQDESTLNSNKLKDANNNPSKIAANLAAAGMVPAQQKYTYQIEKDKIWKQYHEDQKNYLNKYHDAIEARLNEIQKHINDLYYYHGEHYPSEYGLPETRKELIAKLVAQRKELDHEASRTAQSGTWYKDEVQLSNKWKNIIDTENSNFQTEKQSILANAYYNATINNLKSDNRYGNFGYIRPVNPGTEDSYVFFQVTEESPTHETEVATNPVEWGRNITASAQQQATEIEIDGKLFNNELPRHSNGNQPSNDPKDDYWIDPVKQDDQAISYWADNGMEVFYSGINMYPHALITEWNPDYNYGSDGSVTSCEFSMTIQTTQYFLSNENDVEIQKLKTTQKETMHTNKKGTTSTYSVKNGDNLSTIAYNYGVSLGALEKANPKLYQRSHNWNLIFKGETVIIPRKR